MRFSRSLAGNDSGAASAGLIVALVSIVILAAAVVYLFFYINRLEDWTERMAAWTVWVEAQQPFGDPPSLPDPPDAFP